MAWLTSALDGHWNGEYYRSVLPVPTDYRAPYDPNIDIAQSAIYGAESVTDPRLLATAAQLRAQWADPGSAYFYPVNGADATRVCGSKWSTYLRLREYGIPTPRTLLAPTPEAKTR